MRSNISFSRRTSEASSSRPGGTGSRLPDRPHGLEDQAGEAKPEADADQRDRHQQEHTHPEIIAQQALRGIQSTGDLDAPRPERVLRDIDIAQRGEGLLEVHGLVGQHRESHVAKVSGAKEDSALGLTHLHEEQRCARVRDGGKALPELLRGQVGARLDCRHHLGELDVVQALQTPQHLTVEQPCPGSEHQRGGCRHERCEAQCDPSGERSRQEPTAGGVGGTTVHVSW